MRLSHFRALSRKQCCKIAAIFPGKLLRFVKQPELRKSHNKINPSVIDQSTGSFFPFDVAAALFREKCPSPNWEGDQSLPIALIFAAFVA